MKAWSRYFICCALSLASMSPALASAPAPATKEAIAVDSARDAAQGFYQKYLRMRASGKIAGIANPTQLAKLTPLLTPALRDLFAAAQKEQSRCKKLFPEDVPPWIDGDIFTSSSEGFTSFLPQASTTTQGGRLVSIHFIFIDKASKVEWNDTLSLKEIGGVWLVDDVFYRASFAYTSGFGSRLQGSLKEVPAC